MFTSGTLRVHNPGVTFCACRLHNLFTKFPASLARRKNETITERRWKGKKKTGSGADDLGEEEEERQEERVRACVACAAVAPSRERESQPRDAPRAEMHSVGCSLRSRPQTAVAGKGSQTWRGGGWPSASGKASPKSRQTENQIDRQKGAVVYSIDVTSWTEEDKGEWPPRRPSCASVAFRTVVTNK